MGIVFWCAVIFIFFFILWRLLDFCKSKADGFSTNAKLLKCIHIAKNFSDSLYNYLAVNQMISMTSLVLYLYYEYYEPRCFDFKCLVKSLLSDKKVSSTILVRLDIVITLFLIIG